MRGDFHDRALCRHRTLVYQPGSTPSTRPGSHALQTALYARLCQGRMHAARHAEGSLAMQVVPESRAADVDEVPGRALEQYVAGFCGHFGFEATHHACQGERTGLIA